MVENQNSVSFYIVKIRKYKFSVVHSQRPGFYLYFTFSFCYFEYFEFSRPLYDFTRRIAIDGVLTENASAIVSTFLDYYKAIIN